MRVGIDLDNCVYDFVAALARWVHFRTGRPMHELGPATCWEFYDVDWGITLPEYLEFFETGVDAGVVFLAGEPMPGALDALYRLRDDGHSLHIVTDRFMGKRAQENTVRWLRDHKVPFDTLTFSKDKTIVRTDAFIDDRPSHIDALRAIGCAGFVLDCGRTDQAGHPYAIASWQQFVEKVYALAAGVPA